MIAGEDYFRSLEEEVSRLYDVASRARSLGLDVSTEVEVAVGNTLAERIVALFGVPEVGEVVARWVERASSKVEAAFGVISDLVSSRGGGDEWIAELALRVGLAVVTDAVVSAPVEGIGSVRIKSRGGRRHLAVYYNGPIRTAGGTEGALTVLMADYIRQRLGLPRYSPTREEVERYVEEVSLYRRVVHLQYNSTPDEVRLAASNLPVEVTGPPTEQVEVSTYRNVPGVETNRLRGGAVLVLNDCVLQKRRKLAKIVSWLRDGMSFDDSCWRWILSDSGGGGGSPEPAPSDKYMKDAVVGRPILAHPSRPGGFRLRYGRARNTGLASVGVHPATMILLDEFLAVGTQVRIQMPGKSAVVMPVDSIEGPIVLLDDGSVVRVESERRAREVKGRVREIIHLGDVLVAFGEFLENNHPLVPPAWTEEWWAAEVRERGGEADPRGLSYREAREISLRLGVPIHPRWTYFWHDLDPEEVALLASRMRRDGGALVGPPEVKGILERLGVPHRVDGGSVVVEGEDAEALSDSLGGPPRRVDLSGCSDGLEAVNRLAPYEVRAKAPVRIGMRVGRPEKARPRKMRPPVNVLFPLGNLPGQSRQFSTALKQGGRVSVQVALRRCPSCGLETPSYSCRRCGSRTEELYFCPRCGRRLAPGAQCSEHPGESPAPYSEVVVDLSSELGGATERLGVSIDPAKLRGVKGLTNRDKRPEPLEKGVLRAKWGLFVFKDGTIRFDATNAALTHFTPREAGVSVEKLRELGYDRDVNGEPLERDDQLLPLKVQDILIPREAAEYLFRVSKFVDELLVRFYGMEPYYNLSSPEDVVGHLVLTISPHTFVVNVARVVGITDADVIFAHPYLHAAKRRNVDGDEDSIVLALDCLLNFSRSYLPSTPGGREDSPLIMVTRLDLDYVDDECYNMEVVEEYPLEFFRAASEGADPFSLAGGVVPTVGTELERGVEFPVILFTAETSSIVAGPLESTYRRLKSMMQKLESHVALVEKIRAVDPEDAIRRAMDHHFLRDIAGNLRKFGSQEFRCLSCNAKYRRPPLSGVCPRCGGRLTLTIHPGTAVKYLEPTRRILTKYELRGYALQRVRLLEEEALSTFASLSRARSTTLELEEGPPEPREPARRERDVFRDLTVFL